MAFFDTDENLKGALRLSGMPTTGDGELMFQHAVLRASVAIRRALGVDAAALVTAAESTTQDLAIIVERDLVRCELVKTMPYASLDGSAGMDNWFDKEAPFRHMSEEERQAMIERTCARAQEDLCLIAGDLGVDCGAKAPLDCFILEGDCSGIYVGCGPSLYDAPYYGPSRMPSYAGGCGC